MSTGLFKKTLRIFLKKNFFIKKSQKSNSQIISQWFKWLAPGLFFKRWLLLSAAGVLLTSLGLAIWTGMTPIFYILQILSLIHI